MKKLLLSLFLLLNLSNAWASFPTTPVLDTFTRSDGAPGVDWSGPSFADSNSLTITSNKITSAANDYGAMSYVKNTFGDGAVNGVEVYATVSTLPTAGNTTRMYIGDSATSATVNAYYLRVTPSTSTWELDKVTAGVPSQLGTNITQAFSAGDSLGLSVVGTTVTVWYQSGSGAWTSIRTQTDSSFTKKWYIGLELQDNVQRVDNFGGGQVGDNGKGFFLL